MPVQFAYDGQIRRFVIQFVRMVSNFQVEFGQNADGNRTLQTVPVYYGDVSRQAAMILRNNSENSLNAVPAMASRNIHAAQHHTDFHRKHCSQSSLSHHHRG